MSKNVRGLLRIITFFLLFAVLFVFLTGFFERKNNTNAANYMAKMREFYSLPENTLDYAVLGSSHAYCSVNPLEIWKKSGAAGFVLATQQQPMAASLGYLRELFKTQSPKLVILEGYMFYWASEPKDSVICDAVDPLRTSTNKLRIIRDLAPEDQRESYVFNLFRYHSRWKSIELSEIGEVFRKPADRYKGFVALRGNYTADYRAPDFSRVEPKADENNASILSEFYDLCAENGAELAIMIAPCNSASAVFSGAVRYLEEWAKEKDVAFWNYMGGVEELGIENSADWYDGGHLDISGAAKLSRGLADRIAASGVKPSGALDAKYSDDYDYYAEKFSDELDF